MIVHRSSGSGRQSSSNQPEASKNCDDWLPASGYQNHKQ